MESIDGNYFPAEAFFITPLVVRNRVTIATTTRAGEGKGNGTLATFTFEALTVKASNLILFNVLLSDSMGNSSHPRVEGGQVIATPQIFADVNSDSIVNILDLVHVGSNLGRAGLNEADVNGDGVVDIADLVLVAGALNNEAAAPAAHLLASTELNPTDVRDWLDQTEELVVTDATSRRGIRFLEQFLTALTPKTTALLPNDPNPFNPETWIPYHLATASDVTLIIYNTKGEVIRQLYTRYQPAGYYTDQAKTAYSNGRNENGESVASGVYFYQLRTADYTTTRRRVIVK